MKVGVFAAGGIGDALIMMLVANAMQQEHEVVVFNNHLASFLDWFADFLFLEKPSLENLSSSIADLDLVFLQHDNTNLAKALIAKRKQGLRVISFYTNYQEKKFGPLHQDDYPLDYQKPIVHGIQKALSKFLNRPVEKTIGLKTWEKPKTNTKKVILHPLSGDTKRNWHAKKFLSLARKLQSLGYLPYLAMSAQEAQDFKEKYGDSIPIPTLNTLSDLADLLSDAVFFIGNDSGPGHLASYMDIPSIILSGRTFIKHWQPGWRPATIVEPPSWIPNFKGPLRLREKFWQDWISVNHVFRIFRTKINK